jgi:hypothetical protein
MANYKRRAVRGNLVQLQKALEDLLAEHTTNIDEQLAEVAGQPDSDAFVVVPLQFAPLDGVEALGYKIMVDDVALPKVRAYRRLH